MVSFRTSSVLLVFAISACISHVHAAPIPLPKRITQDITDSTQNWARACIAAGGAQQCSPILAAASPTLLATDGPCKQQDSADSMIDLAKQLNDNADMIKFAQLFFQQLPSQSVCQNAPKNVELNGLTNVYDWSGDSGSSGEYDDSDSGGRVGDTGGDGHGHGHYAISGAVNIEDRDCGCDSGGGYDGGWNGDNGNGNWGGDSGGDGGYDSGR